MGIYANFGKIPKSYPQNIELRGHCGADSRVIRAKLSANEIARNFKKSGKGRGREGTNFIKFRAYFEALGTFCPLAASATCLQNSSCGAQFMKAHA
nr:hypothetical protein [uncultured Campylobacter sp.]